MESKEGLSEVEPLGGRVGQVQTESWEEGVQGLALQSELHSKPDSTTQWLRDLGQITSPL